MKTPVPSLLLALALGAAQCVPPGSNLLGRYSGYLYLDTARSAESVLELRADGTFDWDMLKEGGGYREADSVLYLFPKGAKADLTLLVRGDSLIWIFDRKAVGMWRHVPP